MSFASGTSVRRAVGAMAVLALIVPGSTEQAQAGAWTLPQGTGLLIESLFGWVGDGAPWGNGPAVKQNKAGAQTYVEYGLTDQLTIFGQTALERYALGSPTPDTYTGLDYSEIGLRARLWTTGDWVFSGEATVFIPGATNPNAPAEAGNTGGAGEGRLLAGHNLTIGPWPGFLDLEGGYRIRTAGPPDEWHADATLGLKPSPGLMLMVQDFTTVSSTTTDRNFPAWKTSVIEASIVVALAGNWSIQFGVFTSIFAVKTNTQHGVALALWRTF